MIPFAARYAALALCFAAVAPLHAAGFVVDGDGDGVPDERDECLYSPAVTVNAKGCPLADDADRDGVPDAQDDCPFSPERAQVDRSGCALDRDLDGVADGIDRCPDTVLGNAVDARGCSSGAAATATPAPAPRPAEAPIRTIPPAQAVVVMTPVSPAAEPTPAPAPVIVPVPVPMPEVSVTAATPPPMATLPAPAPVPVAEPLAVPMPAPAETDVKSLLEALAEEQALEQATLAPPVVAAPVVEVPAPVIAPAPAPPAVAETPAAPAVEAAYLTVAFAKGSSELDPAALKTLDSHAPDLVRALKQMARMNVEVVGYADAAEAPDALGLARARASIVRVYLLTKGVGRAQLKPRGEVATGAPRAELLTAREMLSR